MEKPGFLEMQALLALERPEEFGELLPALEPGRLLGLATAHRVDGRLLRSLERATTSHDERMGWLMTGLRRRVRARRERFSKQVLPQFAEFADSFSRESITWRALKGAALLPRGIDPGIRTMGDFDVLVPPEAIHQASMILHRLGYRQPARQRAVSRSTHHHDPPWHHPIHPLPIEVHWDLTRRWSPLRFDPASLHEAELHLPGGQVWPVLDIPDTAAHLCVHFWLDRLAGRPAGLGQLWDIIEIFQMMQPGQHLELRTRSAERGHLAVVAACRGLPQLLLQCKILPPWPETAQSVADPMLARFAEERVCWAPPPTVRLLSPHDDVNFGFGRLHRQWRSRRGDEGHRRSWAWTVALRLLSTAFRSPLVLSSSYGMAPNSRLRVRHLLAVGGLLAQAAWFPRRVAYSLAVDRWALRQAEKPAVRN